MAGQPTRFDVVYARLRVDILSGLHAPGSRLLSSALSEQYDASSGVLREVLPRLAGEGLVVSEPQRGFRVTSVSADDLRQLTEARVLIESVTLRQSIEHGTVEFESDLVAAHHRLARTEPFGERGEINGEWLLAHADFHRSLLAGSPNIRLRNIADSLRDATEVYRCWSSRLGGDPDRDVASEHRAIMEATIARDADRAVGRLTRHIEYTTEVLLKVAWLEEVDQSVS